MIFWIVWLVIGAGFVGLSCFALLPRLMMRTYAATLPVRDRAIGRTESASGDEEIFEPAPEAARYISSYRIVRDDKGACFQGVWAIKRARAVYELAVFSETKLIEVIRVREKFNDGQQTAVVRLPKGAKSVSLRMVTVDDTPLPAERRKLTAKTVLLLCALCLLLIATVDFALWLAVTFALRCLDGFTGTSVIPVQTWALFLGMTALMIALLFAMFSAAYLFVMRQRGRDES